MMIKSTFVKWTAYVTFPLLVLVIFLDQNLDLNMTRGVPLLPNNVTLFSTASTSLAQVNTSHQVINTNNPTSDNTSPTFSEQCTKIISGTAPKIAMQKAINITNHQYLYSAQHLKMISDSTTSSGWGCEKYFAYHGYYNKRKPLNQIEESFPVAFGILIYHEVDQFEQLFRAVYRPYNFYCIHVDDSSKTTFKDGVHQLINCFPSNVFVVPAPIYVQWGQSSILRAELECMKMLLLLSDKWKYYINLTGEEFPLLTNMELISILSQLRGSNIVEVFKEVNQNRYPKTLPGGLKKYKSSTHVALHWNAVHYIITNKTISHALLYAISPYKFNDESFFGVLQNNNFALTGFPGHVKSLHDGRGFARYKLWYQKCLSGLQKRGICILGVEDLPVLVNKAYGYHLAANKFFWNFQPMAWDCLQEWHYQKIEAEYISGKIALNTTTYLSRFFFSD